MNKQIFAVLLIITTQNIYASEESPWINVKRLTTETTLTIAKNALDTCRKEGVQIAVTVVDRAGDVQVVLRDVLTPKIALTISKQKAVTALSFNSPTSQLEGRFKSIGSIEKIKGLVFSAGGAPISAGGRILGGVGVSGAPTGELDEKCALAGINAVVDDIEMAE